MPRPRFARWGRRPAGPRRSTPTSGRSSTRFADGRPKTVRWYLMHAVAVEAAHAHDVDEVRWLTPAEACELLTYPSDRDLLDRARPFL